MGVNLHGYRKKLEKLTKAYFETIFYIAGLCKVVPFHAVKDSSAYKRFRLFDKVYQKGLVYAAESLLICLTFFHLCSFKTYVSQNGIDLRSTIHVNFVMVYVTSFLFSVTGTLRGREGVILLNSVRDSRKSELFSGCSWESDAFLQFFTLQIIPLSGAVCLGSGIVLPWLYPDGPWLLTPNIPGFQSLPPFLQIPVVAITEVLNMYTPSLFCLANVKIFMIGFTCIKLLQQKLRFVQSFLHVKHKNVKLKAILTVNYYFYINPDLGNDAK